MRIQKLFDLALFSENNLNKNFEIQSENFNIYFIFFFKLEASREID